MKLKDKLIQTLHDPRNVLVFLNNKGIIVLPDEKYLSILFKMKTKKKLDLQHPKTYNEKLQWLKLHDKNENYVRMVDKFEAKKYVADIIGEEYIIPTYGVFEKFEDIDFEKLPESFVIKCTHNSGGIVICKDKSSFDRRSAEKTINNALKRDYYITSREWPYKNVKPRIIVEKYIENKDKNDLLDYKFFCFNGKIGIVLVCTNRQNDLEETWFDEQFRLLDLTEGGHKKRTDLKKPSCFEQMKTISKRLSESIPHLRVDLYEVDGKIYFGELTFFPAGGLEQFDKEEWNEKLGEMIDLTLAKEE